MLLAPARRTAAALVLSLLLFGCGGDDTVVTAEPAGTDAASGSAGEAKQNVQERPVIAKKTGEPPTTLVVTDLVEGTGAEAVPGNTVQVQYVGALFSDGTEFDASWNRGQPFEFSLGAGMVIAGWDQGVAGMKVGGRRELVIPPDLAYGPIGQGPIGPNATLVFVVDLVAVTA